MKTRYGRTQEEYLKVQRAEDLKLLFEYDDETAEAAWQLSEREKISIDQAFEEMEKAVKRSERQTEKQI